MKNAVERFLLIGLSAVAVCICVCFFLQYRKAVACDSAAERTRTVVIDAGHGGEDGGAVSAAGLRESTVNLAISLRVRDLLAFCGIETRMIRETDRSVYDDGCGSVMEKKVSDLKNRVKAVNETPNAVLLSIHQNHFSEPKYHGAQVFFSASKGSTALAEIMQDCLRVTLEPENRRMCKPAASVYLMQHIDCPGILVECWFLSNPAEAERLAAEAYQKQLSAAICGGMIRWLTAEKESHEV